jgi:SAM-dependent methyltransferase
MNTRDCLTDSQNSGITPSDLDISYWNALRSFVHEFLHTCAASFAPSARPHSKLLEIGPQDYGGAHPFLQYNSTLQIETIDIVPSNATYIGDITKNNSHIIPDNSFDFIIFTEVLEHTLNPFDAVKELHRILKPNGLLFFSTPCNFRIHGPSPDCWRFTHHALQKSLFPSPTWSFVSLKALDDPNRPLFPIDYAGVVVKNPSADLIESTSKQTTSCSLL